MIDEHKEVFDWVSFQKRTWIPILLVTIGVALLTATTWSKCVDIYDLVEHQATLKHIQINDAEIGSSISNISRMLPVVTTISVLINLLSKLAFQCGIFFLIILIFEEKRVSFYSLAKSFSVSKFFFAIKFITILILILTTSVGGQTIQEIYPFSLGKLLPYLGIKSANMKMFSIDIPMALDLAFGCYLAFKTINLKIITKLAFPVCYIIFTILDLIR